MSQSCCCFNGFSVLRACPASPEDCGHVMQLRGVNENVSSCVRGRAPASDPPSVIRDVMYEPVI